MNLKLQKNATLGIALVASLLVLVGCKKENATKSEFVDHIKIERGDASFNYVTTFGSNLEVDIEGEYPINKYGSVIFYNDAEHRFNVGLTAHFSLWDDLNLKEVKTLPNGAKFPMIVTGSMYSLQIDKNIWAYVQKNATDGTQALAGVALQLDGVRNNFPQVSITQSFWKGKTRYASFTVYGPREQNGVKLPGGIFLVGDTSIAVDEITGASATASKLRVETLITGPDAKSFKNFYAKRKLLNLVKKSLAQEGIRFRD